MENCFEGGGFPKVVPLTLDPNHLDLCFGGHVDDSQALTRKLADGAKQGSDLKKRKSEKPKEIIILCEQGFFDTSKDRWGGEGFGDPIN